MKTRILLPLFALALFSANAQVQLPSIFADGIVMQQNANVSLWGQAKPNSRVTVRNSWDATSAVFPCNEWGYWHGQVTTPKAGGPYHIVFSDGTPQPVTLKDVFLGEVWLCSGQSNMEMEMRSTNDQQAALDADYPQIRILTVDKATALTPQTACGVGEGWLPVSAAMLPDQSAIAFYFAREIHKHLNVPVGIVVSAYGGTPQEGWMAENSIADIPNLQAVLDKARLPQARQTGKPTPEHRVPTVLYNAMIAPIVPYTFKGVCWYQGEGNRYDVPLYHTLLERWITSWRGEWGSNMPFLLVQLAGFGGTRPADDWVGIQIEQFDIMKRLPKVATVTAYDIGEREDIHPKNKLEVGHRLALAARNTVYGEKEVVWMGPTLENWRAEGNKAVLEFGNTAAGLQIQGGGELANNFEVAGPDKVFHPGVALITGPATLTIESPQVSQPAYVRYAAQSFNPDVNLYNSAGLPAYPFR